MLNQYLHENLYLFTLKKEERFPINNLIFHLNKLKRKGQINPKASWKKEVIKVTVEINTIEKRKTVEKNQQNQILLFGKINKMKNLYLD